jgi:serralysin
MSTPTTNSVRSYNYTVPTNNTLASLLDGERWGSGGIGAGVALTYSFATTGSIYNYSSEWSAGSTLTSSEQQMVRDVLTTWSNVANVTFSEVADNTSVVGDIRFAKSTKVDQGNASAWTYMPSNSAQGGDMWLSPQLFTTSANDASGSWNWMTVVHEMGHGLGLKHPFETSSTSNATLPTSTDCYQYTIMSYDTLAGNSSVSANFYPQTPMLYDVAAIQYLYGANYNYNAGDNFYTFYGNQQYWQTMWDGGGNDTIYYNSTNGGAINLQPGSFSNLGQAINFSNRTSSNNMVAIAYNCTIENAIGGTGNDTITGNTVANWVYGGGGNDSISGGDGNDPLYGNMGNDVLYGNAGNDTIYGGQGFDTIYGGGGDDLLSGDKGNDVVSADKGNDTLTGGAGNDTLTGGDGNDQFFFSSPGDGVDTIKDFNAAADLLVFSGSTFGLSTGTLPADQLVNGTAAADGNDHVIFNAMTGALLFDADGNGAGAAVQIATLSGVSSLSNTAIYVV